MSWDLDLRCANSDAHSFHEHTEQAVVRCAGLTTCGEKLHEPHDTTQERIRWCPGICDCGFTGRGLHGPGDHK